MKTIAVIDGGTRPNGNTAILTDQVIEGLSVAKILLRDYTVFPIIDMRHDSGGFKKERMIIIQ